MIEHHNIPNNCIMITRNYSDVYFFKSVASIRDLNQTQDIMEIAFVGYSNSGKSSIINILTNHKKLTKVSKYPGSTRLINIFLFKSNFCFLDFPGYGYSIGLQKKRIYWHDLICKYIKKRKNLKGLVLSSDIRYNLKNLDKITIQTALLFKIPILILLNKSDKISKSQSYCRLQSYTYQIQKNVAKYQDHLITIIVFSSIKKFTCQVKTLVKIINSWLFY